MKIIVHIGAGKTGTSSIQATLKENQKVLNAMGFHYLGLILEYETVKKYEWQSPPADKLLNTDSEVLCQEVVDVFETITPIMASKGIHTLIWSNESFLAYNEKIIPVLQALESKYEIEVVAYVRQHESWIQSAYTQWGIKHKSYSGRIKTFKEWYSPGRVSFYDQLKPYVQFFPNKVVVKNMGAQKDLVKSFLEVCGIEDENIDILKINESPSNEELMLRSLFNNNFEENVLPNVFDSQILGDSSVIFKTPADYMQSLMPTENDLIKINSDVEEDRNSLNSLLKHLGETQFITDAATLKETTIDNDKLIMILAQIVMKQAIEIQGLNQKMQRNINDNAS